MRILHWNSLSAPQRAAALERPAQRNAEETVEAARQIIAAVKRDGDAALQELTHRYDGVRPTTLAVSDEEFDDAGRALSAAQHAAIDTAVATVRRFHAAQGAPALCARYLPTP